MDGWTSPYSLEWSNKHVLLFCVPNTHSYKIRMFLIPLFSIYSCVLFFSSVLHSSIPNRPKEDCTKASSHKLILGWKRAFALRITRANYFLETALHLCTECGTLLKMLLCIVQMAQHIVIIISMKKGSWSWSLKLSKISKGPLLGGINRFGENQQAEAKGNPASGERDPFQQPGSKEHSCGHLDVYCRI